MTDLSLLSLAQQNASKCVGEVSVNSQRDGFNSDSLSSTAEPVTLIEVNQSGKYVRLKNTSNEVMFVCIQTLYEFSIR